VSCIEPRLETINHISTNTISVFILAGTQIVLLLN